MIHWTDIWFDRERTVDSTAGCDLVRLLGCGLSSRRLHCYHLRIACFGFDSIDELVADLAAGWIGYLAGNLAVGSAG